MFYFPSPTDLKLLLSLHWELSHSCWKWSLLLPLWVSLNALPAVVFLYHPLVTIAAKSHAMQSHFFENILVNEGYAMMDIRSHHLSWMFWRTATTNSITSGTQKTNADVLTTSFGLSRLALKINKTKKKTLGNFM